MPGTIVPPGALLCCLGATGTDEEQNIYKQFSPDFFDLVIVDECHRGSAADDAAWRQVLDYFSSATQIGLTATPKETKEVSNIVYFGEPVYTYSLRQGIADGFLAPYKVVRIGLDKDLHGWRPEVGQTDKYGQLIEDREYNLLDYDNTLVLEKRAPAVAAKVTEFLKATSRFAKTIIFCENIDHAERMRQEAKRFNQEQKERILKLAEFPDNLHVFEELKRACQRGFVIPFVGAGMSKSAGLPEWRDYLLSKCVAAGLDRTVLEERLDKGEYEAVMTEIVDKLTPNVFERDFERDFVLPEEIQGAVTLLPALFDCTVVTTNFDRVLETVYARDGKTFMEKCTGRGTTNAFFRAIPAGERHLLKLHGNIDNAAERVLSAAEYNQAYGNDGDVNMTYPLPKILDRLFSSYSLLFIGCSLSADRTIQTFMRVVSNRRIETLPHHYALLPSPNDEDRRRTVNRRLGDANITPLWYPWGEHGHVGEILHLLMD